MHLEITHVSKIMKMENIFKWQWKYELAKFEG